MRKWSLIFFLLLIPLLIAAVPVTLVFLALSDTPAAGGAPPADSEDAARVTALLSRIKSGDKSSREAVQLQVSEQEVESLLAFMVRGVKSARATARMTQNGLDARLSIELPANPIGRYANFGFNLLPSKNGLAFSRVSVGNTDLPPQLLLFLTRHGFEYLFGLEESANITGTVREVLFSEHKMTVLYQPVRDLPDRLMAKINENGQLRIADPERVQIYFVRLQEIAASLRGGYVSLTRYVAPVFELAASRGAVMGGDAQSENAAAIMALAIYFGDSRIGKLADDAKREYFTGARLGSHNVTLKGRHDLVQHYLTSAGLQIAAGDGVANAIGEFKEIADTLRGGSGFSFSDIAADRAGVTLAGKAISANDAARVQSILAKAKAEDEFFPDIAGLPDNMTQSEFERRYGDVENPRYRALMAEIERRIARIPAFGGG